MTEFIVWVVCFIIILGISWLCGTDIINLSGPGIVMHVLYAVFLTMFVDIIFLQGG